MIRMDASSLAFQRILERHFRFTVRRLTPVASHYVAHAGDKLETDAGTYIVKAFRGHADALRALHRRIQLLHKRSLDGVPQWRLTADGQCSVRYQNHLYYLLEFLPGHPFSSSLEQNAALGVTLARLHQCGSGSQAMSADQWLGQRIQRIHKIRRTLCDRRVMTGAPAVMANWLAHHSVECDALLGAAAAELTMAMERGLGRALTLVHGDVTVPNVVIDEERVLLIDWERLGPGLAMEELAKAVANTCMYDTATMAAMLAGYRSASDEGAESVYNHALLRAFFRVPREVIHLDACLRTARGRAGAEETFAIVQSTWANRRLAIEWLDAQ